MLRDGASSQYGSDAIAGVINIQLKKASHGGRATASFGKYYTTVEGVRELDGLQTDANGQPILDPLDNRYFLGDHDGERKARDGRIVTIGANIGLPVGKEGYVNLTAEYRDRNPTNRAGYDLRPNYNRPAPPAFDPRELTFDGSVQIRRCKTEDYTLRQRRRAGGGFELYGFGSYGKRDG